MDLNLVGGGDWRDELAAENVRQTTMSHDVFVPWIGTW